MNYSRGEIAPPTISETLRRVSEFLDESDEGKDSFSLYLALLELHHAVKALAEKHDTDLLSI